MDDESLSLFEARQKAVAEHGGPGSWLRQQIADCVLNLLVMIASMGVVMALLGSFPRNPDNSIKLSYAGPVLVALAGASALALRSARLKRLPIQFSCWGWILMAVVYLPAAFIDAARASVS